MKKVLLTLTPLVFTFALNAQIYTTVDKDGYTNIREKPTVSSKIIDKVLKYELIFSADYFCGDEFNHSDVPSNWMAVKKGWGEPVGYIYTKNLRCIDNMPTLYQDDKSWNSDSVTCHNDTLSVVLILKPFDISLHKIEYVADQDSKYIKSVDGEYPKGLFQVYGGPVSEDREMKAFTVTIANKEYKLPIDIIKSYYNPRMVVFIGDEGELYINISSGDGGESYSIMLSVVNGKIVYKKATEAC